MKKIFLLLLCFGVSGMVAGQTIVFSEDFETLPLTQITSSGTPGWGISTQLSSGGLRSDSANCNNPGDSSVLTTITFSTLGYGFVMLEFDHICKIEFYDAAFIEVSDNGGTTWNRLTGAQYLGPGQFANLGNQFNSTSYLDWLPGNPTPPSNSWWKQELFDISAWVANAANVQIRFVLKDMNNGTVFDNYAWFLDNIKVTGAISELTPPAITLVPPVWQGFVFSLGPFPVTANITDTSGIDTAWVVYRVNGGPWDSVPMVPGIANQFFADIPAVTDLDTVDYFVTAIDASLSANVGRYPSLGHMNFVASSGLYTPYFTDFEMADSLWVAHSTDSTTQWEVGYPNYGVLTGAYSGNSAWTTNKDSLYGNNTTLTLTSPYFNFTQASDLILSFWQNRRTEATWDGMHLEYTTDEVTWHVLGGLNDPLGENWYTDTVYATGGGPAWEGSSAGWKKSSYRLNLLNNVPMVRFRFVFTTDPAVGFEGVSIDDFSIMPRPAIDVSLRRIITPLTQCSPGLEPVTVEIRNEGKDTLFSIPLSYHVTGASAPITETLNDTLLPDSNAVFLFSTPVDMQVSGSDSLFNITVYQSHPLDSFPHNDTLHTQVMAGSIPFDPLPMHKTIPYGTATTVTALSADTLFWFADPIGGVPLLVGDSMTTPLLYDSTTYWVEARYGSGKLRFTELTLSSTGSGSTNPYPPYIPPGTQWNGVEITNLGRSPVDLTGYSFHTRGYRTIDYPLPNGVVLFPGEVVVLSVYAFPAIQPDTARNFFVADNQSLFATSQLGLWLQTPNGAVEDAFATNNYQFQPGGKVTAADWSGSIPSSSGKAGVIRVADDTNTASDWMVANMPAPVQSIGSFNPQLPPLTTLGCPGNRVPLHINMASYPPADAGVLSIITPVTDTALTAAETVQFAVKNFGTQNITSLDAAYALNGSVPVTETFSVNINPGDTAHLSFSVPTDMSVWQVYDLAVWTVLPGDTTYSNDTSYAQVVHLIPPYCVSEAQWTSLADIGMVQIGAFTNVSVDANVKYTDFTHLPPEPLIQGIHYPITVAVQMQSTYNYTFGVKVYIDLDGDGVFDPTNEVVFQGLTASGQNTLTGSFIMPYGAKTGLARMRVVARYTSNLSLVEPCGIYNYGETEDYLIQIMPPLPYDAGVTALGSFNPPLIEGSQVQLSARVKNLGSDTLLSLPVGWMISGQSPSIDTILTPIAPGDSLMHTFSSSLTVPSGVFTLKFFTDHPSDGYRVNDTLFTTLLGEKDFTPYYIDDFENDDFNGWTPELAVLWQHGKPAMGVINQAHSPQKVWATRLGSNYLHNMNHGLVTPAFDFSGFSGLAIRFWHWYETEEGFDGGNIKYSVDGGNTFITLGYLHDPKGVNWYNVNAGGRPSFSGHTGQWVHASYDISQFDNHQGPVQFKFDFFSNGGVSYNGWAIDDFSITVEKANSDAGVTSIILPVMTVPQGNSYQVMVRIKNFGKTDLTSVPLAFRVNNGIEIQDTWTGLLQPGQTVDYMMSPKPVSPGYMEIKAYTKLSGDPYHFNDTAFRQVGHIGIPKATAGRHFTVFPNPANGRIQVSLSAGIPSDARFIFSDITGRVLWEVEGYLPAGEVSHEFSLQNVAGGVYLLTVVSVEGRTTQRVVVAR